MESLKLTNIKLDFIKDEEILLLPENNIRGRISSVMGTRITIHIPASKFPDLATCINNQSQ